MAIATTLYKLKNVSNGTEVPISEDTFTLGRDDDCDIVLDAGYPSRFHAQILTKNGKIFVDDLNSTNGTFVNGRKISVTTEIKPGDVIKLATTEFCLVQDGSGDETIIAGNLSANSGKTSYVVMEEEIDPDKTALRQQYPMPPGWPADNTFTREQLEVSTSGKASKEIDELIASTLSKSDSLDVAALVFTSPEKPPLVYGISLDSEKSKWSIGRSKNCDFTVNFPSVSEHHVDLIYSQNQWILKDNKSTNGVRLDGKLETECELTSDSTVSIGQVEMLFREVKWSI